MEEVNNVNLAAENPESGDSGALNETVITDETILNHPLYKNLLEESIQRRKTIKELKEKLNSMDATQEKPQETVQTNPQALDGDAVTVLRSELEQLKASLQQQQLLNVKQSLLQEHGLPNEALTLITGNSPDEIKSQVEAIAKIKGVVAPRDNSDIGSTESRYDDVRTRVLDRVLGKHSNAGNSMYDPRFAARHGGGVINRT